jgi:hypothetical protein
MQTKAKGLAVFTISLGSGTSLMGPRLPPVSRIMRRCNYQHSQQDHNSMPAHVAIVIRCAWGEWSETDVMRHDTRGTDLQHVLVEQSSNCSVCVLVA